VLSYARLAADATNIRPLPATTGSGLTTIIWNFYSPSVGNLRYTVESPNTTVTPSATNEFRYVIIPGSVLGGRSATIGGTKYTESEIRAMSYQQVCRLFNIVP
jgi:hypothetical protein